MNHTIREGSAKRETGRATCGSCPACGFHNGEWETRCGKCGRRLSTLRAAGGHSATRNAPSPSPELVSPASGPKESARGRAAQTVPRPPAFPEHLRRHLQDRVQRYRSRQENPSLALPFEEELQPPAKIISFPAASSPAPSPARPSPELQTRIPSPRPAREREPAELRASPQGGLDFQPAAFSASGPATGSATGSATEYGQPWRLRPVAPLGARCRGHLKDLQLIAAAVGLFCLALPLAGWMGAAVVPKLILAGGLLCGSILLTLLYGLLFLWGAGATPGMRTERLRLVDFDGQPASRRQRLWRFLGAIVSGGSFLIGFLWAAVDEEKLYWHDHISKTYLTRADS